MKPIDDLFQSRLLLLAKGILGIGRAEAADDPLEGQEKSSHEGIFMKQRGQTRSINADPVCRHVSSARFMVATVLGCPSKGRGLPSPLPITRTGQAASCNSHRLDLGVQAKSFVMIVNIGIGP